MKWLKDFKLATVSLFLGAGAFILTFFLFITAYSRFEYQSYLASYKITQQKELEGLRSKANDAVRKIDELLRLTSSRIAASQGDTKRIQNILISAPRLYLPQELPNIQNIAYHILLLLQDVPLLFAERIYKSKIIVEVICPDDLFFFGDPLFIELILMNVLGKSLYRIPKMKKYPLQLSVMKIGSRL